MKQELLTPDELALRWKIGTKTLSQWRRNGRGPHFLKLGRRVMYRLVDIETFEEGSLYKSTVQYEGEV